MQKEFNRVIKHTIRKLFDKEATLESLDDLNYVWISGAGFHPSKGSLSYPERVGKWLTSSCGFLILKGRSFDVIDNVTHINLLPDKFVTFNAQSRITNRDCIYSIEVDKIIPLFYLHKGNRDKIVTWLINKGKEAESKLIMYGTPTGVNNSMFNSIFDKEKQSINDNIFVLSKNGDMQLSGSWLANNETQENKTMNKIMTNATQVVSNSISVATNITTGNATNAAVKAILRPVLEPTLRKLLEPKGLIQRTLGKSKVEDNITLLMDSPLMDVVSAAVLVSLTSSGLIKNDKLVKGASFASDAALVKLLGLIDFDQVSNALTSKISEVVNKLDNTDNKI